MECLEGQTLAARLAKGPLPIAQALQYAIQIASALDTAHRAGIVPRELKPANIMLTSTGEAARLRPREIDRLAGTAGAASAPTVLAPPEVTMPETILGSVDYMAPEQDQR
jgi:serine/threonine protein kinase